MSQLGIENRLYWVRDVTYQEDKSLVRTGNASRVMATLRSLAISLLRLDGQTRSARYSCFRSHERLCRVPAGAPDHITQTRQGPWVHLRCVPLAYGRLRSACKILRPAYE